MNQLIEQSSYLAQKSPAYLKNLIELTQHLSQYFPRAILIEEEETIHDPKYYIIYSLTNLENHHIFKQIMNKTYWDTLVKFLMDGAFLSNKFANMLILGSNTDVPSKGTKQLINSFSKNTSDQEKIKRVLYLRRFINSDTDSIKLYDHLKQHWNEPKIHDFAEFKSKAPHQNQPCEQYQHLKLSI